MNKKIAGFLIMLGIIGFGLSILPGSNEATYIRTDEMKAVLETDTSTAAIKVGIDSLITLAHESWSMTKIYDGHDLTSADTSLIVTTWAEADAGYIRLLHYSAGTTNGGVSPQYFFKTVLDGRWIPLRISVDGGAGVAGYMDIADGTKYHSIILGFATDLDNGAISTVTPGDSIVVIVVPNGATAGANELWAYSKKDYR